MKEKYYQFGTEFWIRSQENLCQRDGICLGCGEKIGDNSYHDGCDWERCPRCGGQVIACGCTGDFCDDSCGDWENKGCEKDHAGKWCKTVPKGAIMHKPVLSQIRFAGCHNCGKEETFIKTKNMIKGKDGLLREYMCLECKEYYIYISIEGFDEKEWH